MTVFLTVTDIFSMIPMMASYISYLFLISITQYQ